MVLGQPHLYMSGQKALHSCHLLVTRMTTVAWFNAKKEKKNERTQGSKTVRKEGRGRNKAGTLDKRQDVKINKNF